MTKVDALNKYLEADKMAAKSRLIVEWLVESLENQDKLGKLKSIDQVNLEMGQSYLESLDTYLKTGEAS